jgi:flagellar biosynthesis GTPase FlhF
MAKKMTRNQVVHAHAQIPSIKKGIEKLELFSKELETLHKKMNEDLIRLSDTHKDEKFVEYEKVFDQFWPTLDEFIKKNNAHITYLQGRIKFIEEEYKKIKF